jgi:hypothetical protein
MILNDQGLSSIAKLFYGYLLEFSPELLKIAEVVEASEKRPYIEEPGTIIIEIPARAGFLFDQIYVETRKEDILIALGTFTHYHFSYYSAKEIEYRMPQAIQYINDILNEKIIFVRKSGSWAKDESIIELNICDLEKTKNVLQVYSWKGTYDTLSQK